MTVYYCCKACQERDWKEGGEARHKVQCKSLIDIKARYVEKSNREIGEHMARFGMVNGAGHSGGGAGPSNNVSEVMGLFQDLFGTPSN